MNISTGGEIAACDYCPVVKTARVVCTDPQNSYLSWDLYESFGLNSRCYQDTDEFSAHCYLTHCNEQDQLVLTLSSGTAVTCTTEQSVSIKGEESIQCPSDVEKICDSVAEDLEECEVENCK